VDGAEIDLSWPKVQRRIAQLIKAEKFYTQEEYDNLDDVDPIAIREHLAQAGIVNGELVDPEALDRDPFIQQVMADADRIAQEEQAASPPAQTADESPKRPGQTRVERNYRAFARQFPEIVSGEYRYLELRSGEDSGLMPLTIQRIGADEIAVAHTYEQNGDLMYDPEMTFRIDTEKGTLEPLTFRQDGGLPIYQEVYPEPGKWIPKLRSDLSAFTDQWLKNIEAQGRVRTKAIAEIDGEDVEFSFDENGRPIRAGEAQEQQVFTSPGGVTYSAGDDVDTRAEDGTMVRMHIDRVDDSYVWYSFPDMPEQEPVNVFRDSFEGWLDDGRSTVIRAEQSEKPTPEHELAARLHAFFRSAEPEEYERQLAAGKMDDDLIAETEDLLDDTLFITETLSQMELIVAEESFDAEQMAEVDWLTAALKGRLPADELALFEEEHGAYTPEKEATPFTEGRDTGPAVPAAERDDTPYHVGDTVYLDDTAYEITDVGLFDVQLRDPTQRYPIFRSESRQQFEQNLYRDRRNAPITDFLAADLDRASGYLRDALTWDGGLLDQKDKELVSELFRNGAGNARVASFLAASYSGRIVTMTMPSGDVGTLTADIHALDLRVEDQSGPVSASRTSWENIAPLRTMYQQDRNGFFREPVLPEPEQRQTYHEETTAFYPGEKNGLP